MKFIFYGNQNVDWDKKIAGLSEEFPNIEFIDHDRSTRHDVRNAHALVGMIPPDQIQVADQLHIVFVPMTGPKELPFEEIRKRNIRLSNTHGNARFVAERAIAMTLAFLGKISEYDRDLRHGKWHGVWGAEGSRDTWNSLHEKRCSIIGTGEIGKNIAKHLKKFNCRVIGFKKRAFEGKLDNFDEITQDLTEAVQKSDIVYITLPLTDETEGMFDVKILANMQDKFLVNVGRGPVIDEEGLYMALKDNILKGAAIDAWYSYPEWGKGNIQPSKYPFHELNNVILSPHIAGFLPEAVRINLEQTIENIKFYLKTGDPRFEIDLNLMY